MRQRRLGVCAFKSLEAKDVSWESRPVVFSWPLRGCLLPSESMDGDRKSQKAHKMDNHHSVYHSCDHAALCSPAQIHHSSVSVSAVNDQVHSSMRVSASILVQAACQMSSRSFPQFIPTPTGPKNINVCILKYRGKSVNVGQPIKPQMNWLNFRSQTSF